MIKNTDGWPLFRWEWDWMKEFRTFIIDFNGIVTSDTIGLGIVMYRGDFSFYLTINLPFCVTTISIYTQGRYI